MCWVYPIVREVWSRRHAHLYRERGIILAMPAADDAPMTIPSPRPLPTNVGARGSLHLIEGTLGSMDQLQKARAQAASAQRHQAAAARQLNEVPDLLRQSTARALEAADTVRAPRRRFRRRAA